MKPSQLKNPYIGVELALDNLTGTPELPGTSEGEEATVSPADTPSTLAVAVCITGTDGGSETIIIGALASEPMGATGAGLKLTPAIVDVVELAKLTAADGCSTEVPLAVGGTVELAFISECDPSAAAFSACSRANWKHMWKN